jgi:D-3-phosphoglycerate dehydrogenase
MEKITITTTSFGEYYKEPLNLLRENGFEIILNPHGRKLNKKEVVELCKDAVGIIAGTETIDAEVLKELINLKAISRCGAGLDNIDLGAAKRLGIKVFNTPDAPTLAVAELTVGLILNLLRKVNQMDKTIRNGKWEKLMGNLLSDKKVGIIGFGRIGKKVAELLKPFECEIRYYDIKEFRDLGIEGLRDLDELLKTSDIISIHVSSKEQIMGENEIKMMKKGAWLVNTSRGGVIDENALYKALKEGHLSGAALDVFEEESYSGPLKELDNVILTPHIGSYALESRIEMEKQAVENLLKGLEGI